MSMFYEVGRTDKPTSSVVLRCSSTRTPKRIGQVGLGTAVYVQAPFGSPFVWRPLDFGFSESAFLKRVIRHVRNQQKGLEGGMGMRGNKEGD